MKQLFRKVMIAVEHVFFPWRWAGPGWRAHHVAFWREFFTLLTEPLLPAPKQTSSLPSTPFTAGGGADPRLLVDHRSRASFGDTEVTLRLVTPDHQYEVGYGGQGLRLELHTRGVGQHPVAPPGGSLGDRTYASFIYADGDEHIDQLIEALEWTAGELRAHCAVGRARRDER